MAEAKPRAPSVWRQTLVLHAVAVTHHDPWLCFPLALDGDRKQIPIRGQLVRLDKRVRLQLPAYRPKRCFLLL